MALIKDIVFTAIDFESAGTASGKTDAPIQVATCQWSLEKGIASLWMSYIWTDSAITWTAQRIHGISKNDLKDAPKLPLLWPQLNQELSGNIVVAHGHGTEKRFLRALPNHGFGPWLDTIQLTKNAYPQLASYSLGDICDTLDLTASIKELVIGKSWHDALFDSVASLKILEHIITTFDLSERSIDDIL